MKYFICMKKTLSLVCCLYFLKCSTTFLLGSRKFGALMALVKQLDFVVNEECFMWRSIINWCLFLLVEFCVILIYYNVFL